MKKVLILCLALLSAVGWWVAASTASTSEGSSVLAEETVAKAGTIGPDVIVGELYGTRLWGTVGDITAYSVATTSCNVGDEGLDWIASDNRHPVIAQNMFRHKDGRFVQLGQSWLKHGFVALAQDACNLGCQDPGTGSILGVGCSDPYSASLNGSHSRLGPRFEVNASTGIFKYPYAFSGQSGNSIYKRLQVQTADVEPARNGGARYFVEGHYITPDDTAAGNDDNNASYREVTVESNLELDLTGPTVQELPAIHAWQEVDPLVVVDSVDVPDDGRFWVGHRVSDNGDGTWRYEYAVQNLNSHRSGAGFSVPLDQNVTVSDVGFRDVPYHSGEPYDGSDWQWATTDDRLTWRIADLFRDGFEAGDVSAWESGVQELDENANALRWGTLYNFWFTADREPSPSTAQIELFRPGTPEVVEVSIQGPGESGRP